MKIQYFINFKVWAGSVVRFLLCEPQVMYHVCLDLYTNWWWYLCSGVGIASLPHFRPVLYDACCTLSLAANMRFLQLTSLVPSFLASFLVAKCKRKSSKEPGNKALLHPAYTDKIPETPREHPKTVHVWACSFFWWWQNPTLVVTADTNRSLPRNDSCLLLLHLLSCSIGLFQ